MNVRVVTMSLGGQQSQFSGEAELNAALSQPGLASVEKQFFMTDGVARYSFVLTYNDVASDSRALTYGKEREPQATRTIRQKFPSQEDVLKAIPAERRKVYDLIREQRNKEARELKIKGYMLANNYQLAHIVCRAPQTMEDLRKVHELGAKYCDLCGEYALEQVKGLSPMGLAAPAGVWWALENCYGEGDDGGRGATALPGGSRLSRPGTDADATSASLPAGGTRPGTDATSASLPAGGTRPGTDAMDCTPPGRAVAPRPPQDDAEGAE